MRLLRFGLIQLALTLGKAQTISIGEAVDAMETLNPRDVTRQLSLLRGEGQTAGMAETMHPLLQAMVQGHPLIEHKTLSRQRLAVSGMASR